MRTAAAEESLLSREELDALLEEMPKVWSAGGGPSGSVREDVADIELQRANESFAFEQGLMLSNRHQRVISISLIGQREIEMAELAELMLPTDLAAGFEVLPDASPGFLLLSRPLFFQLLSVSFGSGPTIKPTRPPTREYSRIERRFYERATREMLEQLALVWSDVEPVELVWTGLESRASVAESDGGPAILASLDVKGFGEACRIRVVIPARAFLRREGTPAKPGVASGSRLGVSVLDVPIRLRAQVGTAELSLGEVGALRPGAVIALDAPSDGSLTIRIGDEAKFRGVAGSQGAKRAVQLAERLSRVG